MSNETKLEDAFGTYWLDDDGHKTYERTDMCGNKYEEDENGHKTYIHDGYRQDENGNRTYFESGLGGPTYTKNEDGSETTYGESLGHQFRKTVSWDKPSELEQSISEEAAPITPEIEITPPAEVPSYEQQLWQQEEESTPIAYSTGFSNKINEHYNDISGKLKIEQEKTKQQKYVISNVHKKKDPINERIRDYLEDRIQDGNQEEIKQGSSLSSKINNGVSVLNGIFFSRITHVLDYKEMSSGIYVRTGKKIRGISTKEYPAEDRFMMALPLHGRSYFLASGNYSGNLETLTTDIELLKKIKGKESKFHTKKVTSMGIIGLLSMYSYLTLSSQSETFGFLVSIPITAFSILTMGYISGLENSKILLGYSLLSSDMKNAVFGDRAKEQLIGEIKEKQFKEVGFSW